MESFQQILLNPFIVPVVAGVAVLLLFWGLSRAGRSSSDQIETRLDRYGRIEAQDDKKGKRPRSAWTDWRTWSRSAALPQTSRLIWHVRT